MKKNKYKAIIDIVSMLALLAAIITGFMLHNEVWHLHAYDHTALWNLHEACGLLLLALVIAHCLQHSFWFRNYAKIKVEKKRVTAILLIIGIIVALSGIMLMCGSHSEFISHTHYAGAILFTAVAIGHVAKRWKILKAMF